MSKVFMFRVFSDKQSLARNFASKLEGIIQFQVPQNIDLEDKIVGPLTLTQFLYLLGGGLIVYMLFQGLARDYFPIFIILGLPITLLTLALAFFKVQEQPLTHFVQVGLVYLFKPKVRLWQRVPGIQPILTAPPKKEKEEIVAPTKKHLEKSELEMLAYNLDTAKPEPVQGKKNQFGSITSAFEQILKEQPKGK